jgi:indole-3-glycerol phosphate synthase
MNSILEEIVRHKREEIKNLMADYTLSRLIKDARLNKDSKSMKSAILQGSGVIAEFKRASPSKGLINDNADVFIITKGYEMACVSAISVITDRRFFKAEPDDLTNCRGNINIPILRKDFTIDPYQIYEAKIMGADCILLIAAILTKYEIKEFIKIADDIGIDSIVEVHNTIELDKLSGNESIIGVNNRNLDTFEVSIENSLQLADQLGDVVKITESGLGISSSLKSLINAGYSGFLVGESFMKEPNPGEACRNFVDEINLLKG